MHIYFSGIGGTGIGPLALIAKQAGNNVSGTDKQKSTYTDYLAKKNINIHIGQKDDKYIKKIHHKTPIDWFVYSSALPLENPNHPELQFVKKNNIKLSKRDEYLAYFLQDNNLKLLAASGTHGKTTTTAMMIWIFKQLGIPISYSVGAKTSFCEMGEFNPSSNYFIYECDEFDKNFLSFKPWATIIASLDWDHHEIYPTINSYKNAFMQFIDQSNVVYLYETVAKYLNINLNENKIKIINKDVSNITLAGKHNRENAKLCINLISDVLNINLDKLIDIINGFPGTSRRFEKLAYNIYTDYAHTPEEIKATIQLASELSNNIMVVYEPLTNRRQHFMKTKYKDSFNKINKLYWLPSYLAREDDNLKILSPLELITYMNNPEIAQPALKNNSLLDSIKSHVKDNGLVLLLAGGGGDSLDEWARKHFK